jgi:hypothetical protein
MRVSVLADHVGHGDQRHGRRQGLLELGGIAQRDGRAVGEIPDQLRLARFDRIGQCVRLLHPHAANRVAGVAQDPIDGFDVFLTRRDDE